ncbi:MAG: UDP-4-amino-4,6-dideoxy-N-acetyl-beta-L-altrosamine N-acetyltransferase [Pseudoalteromonas distincta]
MSGMPASRVRPLLESDLQLVLGWRNHDSVRKYMYTQHEISVEEHIAWFQRASVDQSRHLLIYERDGQPTGYLHFHEIGKGGVAEWGCYVSPDALRGSGTDLGFRAVEHAFTVLKLHKLCGQALAYNQKSIDFQLRVGFSQEGRLRDQHFDGQAYHDIICFGLTEDQWKSSN